MCWRSTTNSPWSVSRPLGGIGVRHLLSRVKQRPHKLDIATAHGLSRAQDLRDRILKSQKSKTEIRQSIKTMSKALESESFLQKMRATKTGQQRFNSSASSKGDHPALDRLRGSAPWLNKHSTIWEYSGDRGISSTANINGLTPWTSSAFTSSADFVK